MQINEANQKNLSFYNIFFILISICCAMILVACEGEEEGSEDNNSEDVTCQAAPACGDEQVEVEACEEGDESCQEVTMCEQTIYCTEDDDDHDEDDDDHEEDELPGDDVSCLAAPACGEGQVEVEACEEGDESCEEVTLCATTIYCTSAE